MQHLLLILLLLLGTMREYSLTQHFLKFFNNQSLEDLLVSSVVGQSSQEPKGTKENDTLAYAPSRSYTPSRTQYTPSRTEDVSNSISNTPSRMSTTTSNVPLRHAREQVHLREHEHNVNLILQKK